SVSQPVLTQPASLSLSPGASERLSCTPSSGYSGGTLPITWYQQKPGSPSRYLLSYNSDSPKHQGSGSPAASLDPKTPGPVQGSCSSLGCSPRPRLTITVL
ncbi:hypothetical protein FD754_024339, partial [Muntiacus muntjak]